MAAIWKLERSEQRDERWSSLSLPAAQHCGRGGGDVPILESTAIPLATPNPTDRASTHLGLRTVPCRPRLQAWAPRRRGLEMSPGLIRERTERVRDFERAEVWSKVKRARREGV